jgi:signal transduction histidine kinase
LELQLLEAVAAALVTSLLVSLALVRLALLPLDDLEETASRVWRGDLTARVRNSPLADRDMTRVGGTINLLLDRLIADRTRVRHLAAQVIEAGDRERARIAYELHDSTAQTLSALSFQAASALGSTDDDQLRGQLVLIRDLAVDALEEVRTLSQTVHPRVLDDLGVGAALQWLARRTREEQGVPATVELVGENTRVPPSVGSVLYNVAQEAVSNAVRHAAPRSVEITLTACGALARLDVIDDGRGFDPGEARLRRPRMGLFAMAERVALVDGTLEVDAVPGRGTRVTATIPMTASESDEP